jgi:hypothetical protein
VKSGRRTCSAAVHWEFIMKTPAAVFVQFPTQGVNSQFLSQRGLSICVSTHTSRCPTLLPTSNGPMPITFVQKRKNDCASVISSQWIMWVFCSCGVIPSGVWQKMPESASVNPLLIRDCILHHLWWLLLISAAIIGL